MPVMMGSGVFAGVYTVEYMHAQKDVEGVTVGDALAQIGYAGEAQPARRSAPTSRRTSSRVPCSKTRRRPIGVVAGRARPALVRRRGRPGRMRTPARRRWSCARTRCSRRRARDRRSTAIALTVSRRRARHGRASCAVKPNSRNVIPARSRIVGGSAQRNDATLEAMADGRCTARRSGGNRQANAGIGVTIKQVVYFAPCEFDPSCVDLRAQALRAILAFAHRDIVSGAAHDAVYMASRRADGDDLRAVRRRHQPQRDRERAAGGHRGRLQRAAARDAQEARARPSPSRGAERLSPSPGRSACRRRIGRPSPSAPPRCA